MNKINYSNEFQKIVETLKDKPKLLLHSCCAPCSTACLKEVTPYFETTVFFYNPNITDKQEFLKRLFEEEKFINEAYFNQVNLVSDEYNSNDFYLKIKGLENEPEGGLRCFECYRLRLKKTAEYAKKYNYDYFATTLTLSPLKNAQKLNEIGFETAEEIGIKYLPSDFKKKGGYIYSINASKVYNLYRQNYCGCEFSKRK